MSPIAPFIVPVIVLVAACTHSYETSHSPVASAAAEVGIPRDSRVLVSMPRDGSYGNKVYRNSGRMTQAAVLAAFRGRVADVEGLETNESLEQTLAEACRQRSDYLIEPEILHWEDRNTEWSGKPDRITVALKVADCATGGVLDDVTISGTSKWATFGGDHPQDLLVKPITQFAESTVR